MLTTAKLMAAVTLNVVERSHWDLSDEVRDLDPATAVAEVVRASPTVSSLVSFLTDCAEALLSTPPRAASRTLALAAVLHTVSAICLPWPLLPPPPLRHPDLPSLVFEPLSAQMELLKISGSAMNPDARRAPRMR